MLLRLLKQWFSKFLHICLVWGTLKNMMAPPPEEVWSVMGPILVLTPHVSLLCSQGSKNLCSKGRDIQNSMWIYLQLVYVLISEHRTQTFKKSSEVTSCNLCHPSHLPTNEVCRELSFNSWHGLVQVTMDSWKHLDIYKYSLIEPFGFVLLVELRLAFLFVSPN